MRHRKRGRTLGRSPAHQIALKRNLARALFTHGRIVTTVPKAKEVRPFVEKLITLAKKGTQHHRRLAMQRLPDAEVIEHLFVEIAPRFADRPGGYTRIMKRQHRRLGDGGETAYLELLHEGEEKVKAKAATETAEAPEALTPTPAPSLPDASPNETSETEEPKPEETAQAPAEGGETEAPADGEEKPADGEAEKKE